MRNLDVIIPVKNEEKNVPEIVKQVHTALENHQITHQIILVVDKSHDNTLEVANNMVTTYPLTVHQKKGKAGKGYSILEGLELTDAEYVGFIDGDLQYPPSALPAMYEKAKSSENHGVVIANRKTYKSSSLIRKIGSRTNVLIFGRLLLGLKCDIQSGLKIFKREIISHLDKSLITPWTFDLPLLSTAKDLGYSITQVDIDFENRQNGASHVGFVKTAYAIAVCALKIKLSKAKVYVFQNEDTHIGAAITYKQKRYITHTKLQHHRTALYTLSNAQKIFLLVIVALFSLAVALNAYLTVLGFVAILSFIYFADMIFNFYLVSKSLRKPPELRFQKEELDNIDDNTLPVYTIMCPLYKEWEVIEQFIENVSKIDWPKEKLEVLLLLEENDKKTIEVANELTLPAYVKTIIVPHSMPKTKPKACNYGLHLATGDYVVVYDAEDQPDPLQLKKAYLAFTKLDQNIFCVQAKLNYYNPSHNLLTRLFTAEYSLWFDVILPSLQSINTTIPLGGTSNHFKIAALKQIHGWDPFNVTEDCDLGVRLFKDGHKTSIIDSVTLEEANSNVKNWIRQRSRWLKGYMQTYLVHMRDPIKFFKQHGWHALIFQLVVGLRISFILINPFLWLTTISYFVLFSIVGPTIESLYPTPIFYMAALSLVFGNFSYLYNYMIGLAKRGQWRLIKYVFFVPFYWVLTSVAAALGFWQLIFKPHHWEKTHHGLHLKPKNATNKVSKTVNAEVQVQNNKKVNLDIFGKLKALALNGGTVLVIAGVASNFLNYIYNAYLSRRLNVEDFGLISLFGSFVFLTSIPLSALTRAITHKTAYYFGQQHRPIHRFWFGTRQQIFVIGVYSTIAWIILLPVLTKFFNTSNFIPFIIFIPVLITNALNAVDIGYLSGNMRFHVLALLLMIESIVRLAVTALIVETGYSEYVYLAVPTGLIASYYIGYMYAKNIRVSATSNREPVTKFPAKFFISSLLARFSIVAYISFDLILAQHYLSVTEAGKYALIALVGKMIFFVGFLFAQFIIPIISKEEGEQTKNSKTFIKLLGLSSMASIGTFIMLGPLGHISTPILFGDKMHGLTHLLTTYGLGMVCFTIASSIASFHQVKDKHLYTILGFILSVLQIVGFAKYHTDLTEVVNMMAWIGVINLGMVSIMHILENYVDTVEKNLVDLAGIFLKFPQKQITSNESLNILMFNWRDTKHIWAGGAEVYLHEIAKQLIKQGHKVTLFCGNDQKSPRHETVDGVYVIRRGGFYTVYIWAILYYFTHFRGKYDVVIDSENGIPFFTPVFVKEPVILLVHHIHQEVILKELNLSTIQLPMAYLAKILETKIMPFVYSRSQLLTVSESSKNDMEWIGMGRNSNIEIINPGIDPTKFVKMQKTQTPTILYLGRLKSYKKIDTLIRALKHVLPEYPETKLLVAGFGEERDILEEIAFKENVYKSVKFLGKVSEKVKARLLAESWAYVTPSSMEGWGITIIEANASGTPVIASKVSGLKDSVIDKKTGFLVPVNDEKAFAEKIKLLIKDSSLRRAMENNAVEWAHQHTWEKSANNLTDLIYKVLQLGPLTEIEYQPSHKKLNIEYEPN